MTNAVAKINRGMCQRQFLVRVVEEDLSEKVTFLQTPDSLVGASLGKRWRKRLEDAGQLKEQLTVAMAK